VRTAKAMNGKTNSNPPLESGTRRIIDRLPPKVVYCEIECPAPGCQGIVRSPKDAIMTRFCAKCQTQMKKHKAAMIAEHDVRMLDRELVAWILKDVECQWCGGSRRNGRAPSTLDERNDPICAECASVPGPEDD
jgi:hypothetical protein